MSRVTRSGAISPLFCPAALPRAEKWLLSPVPRHSREGECEEPGQKQDQDSGMLHPPHMCFSHRTGPHHWLKRFGAGDPAGGRVGHPCEQDRCRRERPITAGYAQQTPPLSGGRRFGCYLVTFSRSCLFQTLQFSCCKTTIIMFTYLVKLLIHGEESVRQQHFSSPC